MADGTTAVATELDQKLLAQLDEKRAPFERSRAAELRMAIRAWVANDSAAEPVAEKAA